MQITDEDLKMFKERSKTELESKGDMSRLAWDVVVCALCDEVARLRSGLELSKRNECPMMQQSVSPTVKGDIENRFECCVCDQFGVSPDQCRPQASFVDDLGADELDPVELVMELEVEFGICFTDQEVEAITTYEKLLNLVKEKVDAKRKGRK